jgi:TorA maturation chaperone TorD
MTKGNSLGDNNILKAYNMMLYFAGTMVMWDPSNECIHDFWTQGMIKSLPVSSQNPTFMKAAAQLRSSVADELSSHERMKEDYLALFSGKGKSFAPPYESVYLGNEQLLFGKQTSEVRAFYQSYGWVPKYRNEIPDDHLGIELLFLTLLIQKYLEFDDDACIKEMRSEIRRYISSHLLTWIPKWNEDIQKNSITLSYKGIANLVHGCLEDVYSLMGGSETGSVKYSLN